MNKLIICHGCAGEIRQRPYYEVKIYLKETYHVIKVWFHTECLKHYKGDVTNIKEVT